MDAAMNEPAIRFPRTREEIMDHNYSSHQQHRHAFLSIFLTVLALGFSLFVLILISGGFFLYVVLFGGAFLMLGLLHYALWGRAFSEEVSGEREEELLRRRAAALDVDEPWQPPETRIRR
jgi:hypothetical protein